MPASDQGEQVTTRHEGDRGLGLALLGLCVGFVLAIAFVAVFAAVTHHPRHPSTYGSDIASLAGLWIGLLGAVFLALSPDRAGPLSRRLAEDYGLRLRPWPDIPLGIAAGVAGQFLLVPLFELLLYPFVPHLFTRLSAPANDLVKHVGGPGLAVLGVLVCLGSPLVEELFFRGLVLRRLSATLRARHVPASPVLAVAITAVVFGLVHFETLQLIGLIAFGALLGTLAWRTKRLGPGIVAHVSFNAVTFIALAGKHG